MGSGGPTLLLRQSRKDIGGKDIAVALLVYLSIAFQIWMIVDAVRRRAQPFWYLVLLFPLGALVYFFAVKVTDFLKVAPAGEEEESAGVDIEELAREVADSPSFANRFRMARALFEAERYEEAAEYFSLALSTHAKDREALYGLGLSQLELGDHARAVETLTTLLDLDFRYSDYEAAESLARALWEDGRKDEAISLLKEIKNASSQLRHKVKLAQYLSQAGLKQEAASTLEEALRSFAKAPEFIRRREAMWATEARVMLRRLAPSDGAG